MIRNFKFGVFLVGLSLSFNSGFVNKASIAADRPKSKSAQKIAKTEAAALAAEKKKNIEDAQAETRNNPFQIIEKEIDYSYAYDKERAKFEPGLKNVIGKTSRTYTVLVNFHEGNTLNLTSLYDPNKRTLIWGVPYQIALNQAMSMAEHAHDQSALLTSWSSGNLRGFISFVIIPQDTEMQFLIGAASPQNDALEYRPGQGMQIRLKYLPKGTIVLTQDLAKVQKGEKETLDLHGILEDLVTKFNDQNKGEECPKIKEGRVQDYNYAVPEGDFEKYVEQFFKNITYKAYP